MGKLIKVILIVVGALLALMIILPLTMKNKINEMVKMEAAKFLDAQFDFEDLSISLFRNFPNASIHVKGVSIVGNEPFSGDTLLAAREIGATVNILSLFGSHGFQIKEVLLNEPLIQGLVNADGKVNWDIVKLPSEQEPEKQVNADESVVSLHLKEFRVKNAEIRYKDIPAETDLDFSKLNLLVSGNFDADRTDLKTDLEIASVSAIYQKIAYVKNMELKAQVNMDADLANKRFNFNENTISVNAIQTAFEGWVAFPDSTQTEMDLKLNTSRITFKELLSLIPAIYKNDFDKLKAEGVVQMNAMAKGILKKESLPAFETNLTIENGAFRYSHLPEGVSDIQVKARVASEGGALDLVKASVDRFHFLLAGNPFDLTASASNMQTDLQFALSALGKMNLSKLRDVYPLPDSMAMDGILTADLKVAGSMAQINRKQYENIAAQGKFQLEQFDLKRGSADPLAIRSAVLFFTPRYVELQQLDASIGKNDVRINGKLEQFIPYMLKNETLKGSLQINSNYLCVNDFMSAPDSTQTQVAASDSVSTEMVIIPKNLDLTAEVNLNEVVMDKIQLTRVKGKMQVNNGKAILNGLTFNAFDGTVGAAGTYDSGNPESPSLDMAFDVKGASFSKTFASVMSLQKMAPVFENMQGTYAMNMVLRSGILPGMALDLNSVEAKGSLQSSDVHISGVAALDKLAEVLKSPSLKEISPKDLNLKFVVKQGKMQIEPFTMKIGDTSLTLGGITGLDQSIDYKGTVTLGGDGVSALGIKIKNVPFTLTGTFKSPQVALDTKTIGASVVEEVAGAAEGLLNGLKKKLKKSANDTAK